MNKNNTLNRSLDILLLFSENTSLLTVSEIEKQLLIPRSTAYRYVKSLKQKGLIEPIGYGYYQPGWAIFELVRATNTNTNLIEISLPIMETLSKKTKETVALTVPFGIKARVISHVESSQMLKLSYITGQDRYLYKGAPSKVILANLEKDYQNFILKEIKNEKYYLSLNKELELIKKQGFVVTNNEVDLNTKGVAAPIFRPNNSIAGSISVAGPEHRIDNKLLPEFIHLVKDAAQDITSYLRI